MVCGYSPNGGHFIELCESVTMIKTINGNKRVGKDIIKLKGLKQLLGGGSIVSRTGRLFIVLRRNLYSKLRKISQW